MKVWLVTIGEPLPTDGSGDARLHRTGIFAGILAQRGHDVVWWTSAFDHFTKTHRTREDEVIDWRDGYRIRILQARGYGSNVSLGRVLDHRGLARRFARQAPEQPPPDVIVAAMPTPGLALASADYGRDKGVPVVLDVRDLWPDVFLDLVPAWLRPLASLPLVPMRRTVAAACAKATAISGATPRYVEWGLEQGRRTPSGLDRSFPMGYPETRPDSDELDRARAFWAEHGLTEEDDCLNLTFFGTFGRQFDIETVIEAARLLDREGRAVRFVLCGAGENLAKYKSRAAGLGNVVFPGWINAAQIWTMLRMSSVGLAPYKPTKNFLANIANKPLEYLSAGLPILAGLRGMLGELVEKEDCGVVYDSGRPEQLARILRSLHEDRARLEAMSRNARVLFEQRFSAEKVYGEMAGYLGEVVESRGRSR